MHAHACFITTLVCSFSIISIYIVYNDHLNEMYGTPRMRSLRLGCLWGLRRVLHTHHSVRISVAWDKKAWVKNILYMVAFVFWENLPHNNTYPYEATYKERMVRVFHLGFREKASPRVMVRTLREVFADSLRFLRCPLRIRVRKH